MKVTLAICTNREVKPRTTQSLLEMVNFSDNVDWHILVASRGFTIAENRNYCVVQAQRNQSDYLLFVDDDMTFPDNTFEALQWHEKEVVGVNSYSRLLPPSTTVGLMDKDGNYKHPDQYPSFEMQVPEELFKAYFVGAGVMLIKMSIFSEIKAPFFEFTTNDEGMVVNGEDGTFCEKVKAAGYDIWCDPTLEIGHIGEYEYKKPESREYHSLDEIIGSVNKA